MLKVYIVPLVLLVKNKQTTHLSVYCINDKTVNITPNSEYSIINIANVKPWYPSKNCLSSTQLLYEAGQTALLFLSIKCACENASYRHSSCVRVVSTWSPFSCKDIFFLTAVF